MKYKMVVADFDGTIYTDSYDITQKTKDVFAEFIELGGMIFIATGRLFSAIQPHAQALKLTAEVITYQGSGIYDLKNNELVYNKDIDPSLACEVFNEMSHGYSDKMIPMLFFDDKCYVEEENVFTLKFSEVVKVPLQITGEKLSKFIIKNNILPTKILALVPPKDARSIIDDFKKLYKNVLNINQSGPSLVEMVNIQASKGNAVAWLAKKYNVNREEIICIGDSENDNSMLEYAGLGIAMGNAMEVTKAVADYITDTNNNDGVAKAIEKFCLNR